MSYFNGLPANIFCMGIFSVLQYNVIFLLAWSHSVKMPISYKKNVPVSPIASDYVNKSVTHAG